MSTLRVFRSPRDIVWGRGTFSHLQNIPGRRVLIVTDGVMTALGVTDRAKGYFRKGGLEARVFDEVEPEPSIDTVLKMLEKYRDFHPDVIAGIGGGSSMDASKAFRVFTEHPQLTFEDIRYLASPPKAAIPPFKRTTHVAVPSTSGTGSDVTHVCVLTDPRISAKCPIRSSVLTPDMAIVDPDIADTMPPAVLADSGLDALTHAIESYVSIQSNDFSQGLSLQAITLVMKHLPPAFTDRVPEAKEHMHYAATIAGIAFSNSSNGLCHTIADKVGASFKLSHGRANAIALPYVIKYNSRIAGAHFANIARALGYRGEDPQGAVEDLIRRISAVRRQLGVPGSYKEAGIPERAYDAKIKEFATRALTFPATAMNPRKPTIEELESLFAACFHGDYNHL
jgi:alcohol dehydrogenase class IV